MKNSTFKKKLYKFLELFLDVVVLVLSFNFASVAEILLIDTSLFGAVSEFFNTIKDEFFISPFTFMSKNVAQAIQNIAIVTCFVVISRIYRTSLLEQKYSKSLVAILFTLIVSNTIVVTYDFYMYNIGTSVEKSIITIFVAFTVLASYRWILWQFVKRRNRQYIAIVSTKENSMELMKKFLSDESNYKVLKYLILEEDGKLPMGYEKKLDEAHETYISDDLSEESKSEIIDYVVYNSASKVNIIPKFYEMGIANSHSSKVDDVVTLSVKPVSLSLIYRFIKRVSDILISSVMMIVIIPFILLVTFVNKIFYKVPVFNSEKNITYKIKTFNKLTFNTQKHGKTTGFGKVIEFTRIKKMPQFYNVFIGKMSVVGVKPHEKSYLTEKDGLKSIQFRRNVKAGIISYEELYSTSNVDIDDTVRFDVYYVTNASSFTDIKILLLAFANVLIKRPKDSEKGSTTLRGLANSSGYSIVNSGNIYTLNKSE